MTISTEEYCNIQNELSNLRGDNERFKAERDLSRIEEGRNEAQQFLDDLVFEISGVEK